ncbi:hypothetical protein [Aegicerativicinus sediminis]|uniref:hypothetical protein n=1 Tax=Aegicerativicinus sediminis TaxID=2893202 RepID=UPI001E45C490|nr:hypothetical protein [Aegicerativicinus sediminis]
MIGKKSLKSFFIVALIVLLGSFEFQIIEGISDFMAAFIHEGQNSFINQLISSYGSSKSINEWIANYLVFYPIYLSCHFLLIHFLFINEPNIGGILKLALLVLLLTLIVGKLLFGYLQMPILAEYVSFAFHKLIGLPFLLLAIEGGRQFYKYIFIEDRG